MIDFKKALFIRLGDKGSWAQECIDKGVIRLSFKNPYHQECLKGNWDLLKNHWVSSENKTKGKATDYTNQVKNFYTSDSKVLWVTFHNRKLYYCFSEPTITELYPGGERDRPVIGKWSCKDLEGKELTFDRLSTKLTKTQGYQGTICEISEIEYLKNKINSSSSEITALAKEKKEELVSALVPLLQDLNWYDFELLIDLIFTYSGWKRIETLGKTQESIDLDLQLPINESRAFVQIKSKSAAKEYYEYKEDFDSKDQYNEFYYFVNQTSDLKLIELAENKDNHIFTGKPLAELVLKCGLLDWVIEKTN